MFSALVVLALALPLAPVRVPAQLAEAPAQAAPQYQHLGATPPPHGLPEIRSTWISTTNIRAGTTVSGRVQASENVTYVEARIQDRAAAMHKDGEGRFSLSYHVPWWLPPWLRHGYTLEIVARTLDGVETRSPVSIVVR